MFVGESGVERIVMRSAELMKQDPNEDVRAQGGIDLPTLQKYLNLWYAVSLDLFGGEISSNAADAFAAGLKGRYKELSRYEDHRCLDATHPVEQMEGGKVVTKPVPLRNALNEILREDYIADCQRGVDRWNKVLTKAGIDFELRLPSRRFNRGIGQFADLATDPDGALLSPEQWEARKHDWLPSAADEVYIHSLMQPVIEPGKIANWIAPPRRGINGLPLEFEYVRGRAA
jgi:benzoyl-CoA 2,3-dioxygenase component B